MSVLFVVAAALINGDGKVLIQRRGTHQAHAGMWEFPGGKVEKGEIPSGALARELAEELNLTIDAGRFRPCAFVETRSEVQTLVLLLFVCDVLELNPESVDGQAIVWASPAELCNYPMPEADIALLPKLQTFLDAGRDG